MSKRERRKGVEGEREVRRVLTGFGYECRGLEGSGDWIAVGRGVILHVEVKRQETLRLPLWTRQALAEAPAGTIPVVAYRRSREPWRVVVPISEERAADRGRDRVKISGVEWFRLTLDSFAYSVGPSWVPVRHRPPESVPATRSPVSSGH